MNRPLVIEEGTLLLVGEGNFSFSVALQKQIVTGRIVSTSLLSEEALSKIHPTAQANIKHLKEKGVKVIHKVDATKLETLLDTLPEKISRICFNFPHVGGKSNIKKNRQLLKDFFVSADKVLHDRGDVCVSLCKGQGGTPADPEIRAWHDAWQVVSMATYSNLILNDVTPFSETFYPEYVCTGFRSEDRLFHTESSITYVFCKAPPLQKHGVIGDISKEIVTIDGHQYLVPCHIAHAMQIKNCQRQHHPLCLVNKYILYSLKEIFSNFTDVGPLPIILFLPQITYPHLIAYPVEQVDSKPSQQINNSGDPALRISLLELVPFLLEERTDILSRGSIIYASGDVYRNDVGIILSPSAKHEILLLWKAVNSISNVNEDKIQQVLNNCFSSCNNTIEVTMCRDFDPPKWLSEHLEIQTVQMIELSYRSDNVKYTVSCNQVGDMGPPDPNRNRSSAKMLKTSQVIGYVGKMLNCDNFYSCVLSLEQLTIARYDIPHVNLLSEESSLFLDQFSHLSPQDIYTCHPVSYYPPMWRHDISFWENSDTPFDEGHFFNIIQDIAGHVLNKVILRNVWKEPNSSRVSRCYRQIYQSFLYAVSHAEAHQFQNAIRLTVEKEMGVILR